MEKGFFEHEIVEGPRRSARIAWTIAIFASLIAIAEALAIAAMMPLRETEVFSVLVDRATGQAEKIVEVLPQGLSEEDALKESLLVAYVTDRESYFLPGIQARLESVQHRSSGAAETDFVKLWTDSDANSSYPPDVYGSSTRVDVKVRAVTFLNNSVARVRFTKTLTRPRVEPVVRSFIATVGFVFDARKERTLERVWQNPLGFTVTDYAVDAETLENQ